MILIGPGFMLLIFLMMFRPVRFIVGWLLIIFVALVIAHMKGWIGEARSEMSSIVQCRIGSYAEMMPDYVCAALVKGASKLTADGGSQVACHDETLRHIRANNGNDAPVWNACGLIFAAKEVDRVTRRSGR